jgi:hypothetical protein
MTHPLNSLAAVVSNAYNLVFYVLANWNEEIWGSRSHSRNKGGASGALTPGAVHVGAQN